MSMADERDRLLERYQHFRALSRSLHSELLHQVAKSTLMACADKLGFLVRGTLVFDDEEQSSFLMDYCIYDGWNGEHNAVSRFLEEKPYPPDSDETTLLQAMSKARYSLYQVQSVTAGVGVNCLDILRGDGGSIIDVGLGTTAVPGLALAARLLTLPDFAMTTGASLPVDADALVAIRDSLEGGPVEMGKVDYNRLSRQQQAMMSSVIIRSVLGKGASSRIAYEGPVRKQPQLKLVRSESPPKHVSRNDPCPCGSGRKYKKCCGK